MSKRIEGVSDLAGASLGTCSVLSLSPLYPVTFCYDYLRVCVLANFLKNILFSDDFLKSTFKWLRIFRKIKNSTNNKQYGFAYKYKNFKWYRRSKFCGKVLTLFFFKIPSVQGLLYFLLLLTRKVMNWYSQTLKAKC